MRLLKNRKEYQQYLTGLAIYDHLLVEEYTPEDGGQLPPMEYPCLVEIKGENEHSASLRFIYRKDVQPLFDP